MCLYIRDKQPRVAERDIVVSKYLEQTSRGYESPCQGVPVTLGKLMVAQPDTPYISYVCKDLYGRKVSSIGGGVIHAKLVEDSNYSNYSNYGNYCAKAIIPKGTEYWVNPFGTEIAARQMLITKEKGTNESVDVQLFKEILESAPEKNGIRVGDYQMIDDSFIHPTKNIAKTEVRGIVCGFYEDGNPIICALEMFREVWGTDCDSKIEESISQEKAIKLFNGREVTAQHKKQIEGKDREGFGAFERCINYRKDKKEDWYFGSLGETMTMLDNAAYLNAAHKITGLGFIISTNFWCWSCSERFCYSWYCGLYSGRVNCRWGVKGLTRRVVPFYASTPAVKDETQDPNKLFEAINAKNKGTQDTESFTDEDL